MEFRVLGPLEVVENGRAVPLDRQRMRTLLAYLLVHANEVVSRDRLIDEVWGPEPAKTAGASLQNYVSRLRKALGADRIASQAPGYVLRVDPERFDLARFERLTAEARGAEATERAEKLRAALALWRGPVLEDLAFEPFVQEEARRLEEARLAAVEERIEADLDLGRDGDLVGELEQLVEEHPLRERFHGQLMRALYRAGRQADALAAYQEARRILLDELGLQPSVQLRELEQAILRQDPLLGPPEPAAVERSPDRRTVTVLFCDLVDSTRLASELDPEAYRRLMSRYFELVREPIERHGGTLEKFIGDAVMAVFGVPELHEDDALRAVRAAVEARDALTSEEWDPPVAAGIGVSTGEVHVLSAPAEPLHVSGAAASVASRLEGRAGAGEILLSEATYALVRDALDAEPADGAWRVRDVVPDAPAYARRLDSPLVGREDELERLRSAYERLGEERRCQVVTVIGEAGIGKTRLARELVAPIRNDAQILVGRCVSYGEGATYLPIVEVLRTAARKQTLTGIRELVEAEDDADAIAQRIAELVGIEEAPAAPGETLWAVRRLFESLARERPLVVVLDDIHWAEPTLLDLIEYLGKWAVGPILVLCLARGDLLDARPGWGGPTSTGFVVRLEPLPPDEVGALVQQLASGPVDPAIEERIVEHAGGNPLFAEQLLELAAEAPELLDKTPPTVDALIASRLDRLDPRELAVVRRAAVIGRRFSRVELEDLAGDDPARHLDALAKRGLIHPAADVFRFHHVLVRDVAYRGIPKAERSELHELAARGLDSRDGADELVGYHFEQAHRYLVELARPDDHARELARAGGERLGRAGIRAWRRADAPAALNLLGRALALLPAGDVLRRELGCELGAALHARGDSRDAQDVLTGVVAESTKAGDERVTLRAEIELAFVRSILKPDRAADLLDIASKAIPVLESYHDDRALGRAWLSVGHIRGGFRCEYAAWEEAASRAVTYYRRAGWSPSSALQNFGTALFYGPAPVDEAIARCEALLREHGHDRASEANILVWKGPIEAMRGEFEEATSHVAQARELYESLGLAIAVTDGCGQALGAVEMLAGRPDEAERALRRACELLQETNQTGMLATRAGELAAAIYAQGDVDEAEEWTAVARECSSDEDLDAKLSWQPVQARILAARGELDDAEALARETLQLVGRTDALNRHAETLLVLAEILRLRGRVDDANDHVSRALHLYGLKGNTVAARATRALL